MSQKTYSSWFVICHAHNEHCPNKYGVHTNPRPLKGEVFPASLKDQPAFYFKHCSQAKVKSILRHFPKEHGFEIVFRPRNMKVLNVDGVFTMSQDQLELAYATTEQERDQERREEIRKKKDIGKTKMEKSEQNGTKRVCLGASDYSTQGSPNFEYDFLDDDNLKEEEVIHGCASNISRPRALPSCVYENFFQPGRQKTKTRKCKKVRQLDDQTQMKNAVKSLFEGFNWCKQNIFQVQNNVNTTNELMGKLSEACYVSRTKVEREIANLRRDLVMRPTVVLDKPVHSAASFSEGKTLFELATQEFK